MNNNERNSYNNKNNDIDPKDNNQFTDSSKDVSHDNHDIEDQIAKSIEKLVEEETNVARAFVNGGDGDYSSIYSHDPNSIANENKQQEDFLSGKTQVIPEINMDAVRNLGETRQFDYRSDELNQMSDSMNDTVNDLNIDSDNNFTNADTNLDTDSNTSNTLNTSNTSNTSNAQKNPERSNVKYPDKRKTEQMNRNTNDSDLENIEETGFTKKKKLIIAGIIALAVVMIGVIITAVVIISNNRKSFDYNYKQGLERFEQGKYDDALPYFEKAFKTVDGKKNADLMYDMFECYKSQDNVDKEKSMLKDLIAYDKYNEKGIKALAQVYLDEEDGSALTDLIKKYRGTKAEDYLKDYELDEPEVSDKGGDYNKAMEITLTSSDDTTIYYTTDGKEPTKDSSIYMNPIKLDKGTTVIKAFAMNSIGLCSDITENKYVIEYKKPDAPSINPSSGSYEAGQTFTIDNIADGDTAYYTLDGSDPTTSSKEYTGEVEIPEGNIVVAAIIVNHNDLESSITRRNYNIKATKTYSYDEAKDILTNRMISRNDLKSADVASSGNKIQMVYQNKIKVSDVEMYYIRIDESKNNSMVTTGYYGVGTKDGKCYKVTTHNGSYVAQDY